MSKSHNLPGTLVAATLAASPAAAGPALKTGYYTQLFYVQSASATAGTCTDAAGAYFTETAFYPGPLKNGAKSWRAFNGAGGLLLNEIITFPQTPAAGAGNWSGAYKATILPGGPTFTATFDTTGTITDPSSSLGTTKVTYPTSAGGTCSTTLQINQSYTGK